MKIQNLAIIFIIIIIPISLVLSVYTQFQIQTIDTQTLYDTKLTTATFDAIKAFQLNTANSTMSDLSNSKLRDIEASIATFKNSLMSTFELRGYSEEDLNNFIPALVYTMYDGFYIYSPYENVNHQYETIEISDQLYYVLNDGTNALVEGYTPTDPDKRIPLNDNGETIYGLKPYITYSARYTKGNVDVVITYSLDNYISVQGMINGKYENREGYLIDGISNITYDREGKPVSVEYNLQRIEVEELKEYVDGTLYPYAKINGTKYYYDNNGTTTNYDDDEIFYLSNGQRTRQGMTEQGKTQGQVAREYYEKNIQKNNAAVKYYVEAAEFTNWVRTTPGLKDLTYEDAQDFAYVQIDEDTGEFQSVEIERENRTAEWATKKIFAGPDDGEVNIENDLSNFNVHRLEIIRHKIESNLSVAISNYNSFSSAVGIEFQLPQLKEYEWDFIINNISLISFVQGLDIGGKIYNGYTIVNNTETKEVVQEENIYIIGQDNYYHRVGDKYLETSSNVGNTANNISYISAGRSNLDFIRYMLIDENSITRYYYPLPTIYGSYNSIITQNDVTAFDDIYAYIQGQIDAGNDRLAKAFYTALGRERYGMYKALRTNQLFTNT